MRLTPGELRIHLRPLFNGQPPASIPLPSPRKLMQRTPPRCRSRQRRRRGVVSEFARAVLQHPVAAERREAEREANRLFKKLKVPFRDAVVRDKRLTRTQRLIGYEIADRLNFKTGYAWPSQELIAEKVRCDVRTVRRAMERLTHETTGWFRRELDGKNYCYFPRFERLNQPPQPVENTGHLVQRTPDIQADKMSAYPL